MKAQGQQTELVHYLTQLLQAQGSPLLVVDEGGTCLDSFGEHNLFPQAEPGQTLRQLFPEPVALILLQHIQRTLRLLTTHTIECTSGSAENKQLLECRMVPLKTSEAKVMCIFRDLTASRELETTICQRLHYQKELHRFYALIMATDQLKQDLSKGFAILGMASDASSVYLYELEKRDQQAVLSCQFAWSDPRLSSRMQPAQVALVAGSSWANALQSREMIVGNSPDLADDLRDMIRPRGVACLLAAPLIQDEEVRGFLVFETCDSGRFWAAEDLELAEIAASMLRAALERDGTLRSKEQMQRRLQKQQTMAMRMDRFRALGEMAAGMAHEINQPLSGIRGFAETVLIAIRHGWSLENEEIAHKMERIIQQSDRISLLIEHLRAFTREADRQELMRVELETIIRASEKLIRAQWRHHGIDLQVKLPRQKVCVFANPFALEEVMLNLLRNARDAVELQAHLRKVCCTLDVTAEGLARIQIRDWGVGIPVHLQDRVFEPFFTTKGPDRGTGLGLSVAKHLLEEMQGSLTLLPAKGGGTLATLFFPLYQEDQP